MAVSLAYNNAAAVQGGALRRGGAHGPRTGHGPATTDQPPARPSCFCGPGIKRTASSSSSRSA